MVRDILKRMQGFGLLNFVVDGYSLFVSHQGYYDYCELKIAYKDHKEFKKYLLKE